MQKKIAILILHLFIFCTSILDATNLPFTIGQDTSICVGDTILIQPSIIADSLTYQWSTGDTTAAIQAFNQGLYQLTITSPNCVGVDSLMLTTNTLPTAIFNIDSTCLNSTSTIINQSLNLSSNASVQINYGDTNVEMLGNLESYLHTYSFPGNYNLQVITDNNGCTDTLNLGTTIFPLPSVSMLGIDSDYCQNLQVDTLIGMPSGGFFYGNNVIEDFTLSDNIGIYDPVLSGTNDLVYYEYTDLNNCMAFDSFIINNVFPDPGLEFIGIESPYCVDAGVDTIFINSSGGAFGGNVLDADPTDNFAIFNANTMGSSIVEYSFETSDGCFYEITEDLVVNGIPEFTLGSDTSLVSGESILIGYFGASTSDLSFLWSTGQSTSQIEIFDPGFYLLEIFDNLTSCVSRDTILVEFITDIKNKDDKNLLLFPNPAKDILNTNILDFGLSYDTYIFNSVGKLVFKKIELNANNIDLTNLESGLFYINFYVGDQMYREQLIINK